MVHRSLAVALALIAGHAIAGRATAQETAPPPDYPAVPLLSTSTYILDGELTVDYGKHGKRTYLKGQTFMEAMNAPHVGINTGSEPVRLLAVYMGAKHAKDVIPLR